MKRHISRGVFFLILFLFGSFSVGFGAVMSDYCQTPPFIGSGGEPNLLILNDASGSMTWEAYSYGDSDTAPADGILDKYNPNVAYEGYFDPTKSYAPDMSGIYEEKAPSGLPCTVTCSTWVCRRFVNQCSTPGQYGGGWGKFGCAANRYGCCSAGTTSGDCSLESGNYLNYKNMHRLDLLRWAVTGGRPASCNGSFNSNYCDPEVWALSGNSTKVGSACNDSLDVDGDGLPDGGCILWADNGTKVKVRWSRVYDGLAYQFMTLPVKPRLGMMSYNGSSSPYVNADKVFLGDFLASNNNSATYPYLNLITAINSQNASGMTPTGPAMWDALNYFSMKAPLYGGFNEQSGAGDRWKNPLYVCDGGGGNNCVQNSCARNFVMLMSDGEWNTPSSTIGTNLSCTGATKSSDPLVPAWCMHNGFTNTMNPTDATDDVVTKVSAVYTVGLFMNSVGLNAMKNVAMYGGFDNSALTWPSGVSGFPTNANGSLGAALPGSPPSHPDWDRDGDNVPDTFFSSDDALGIKQNIMDVVTDILARVTSGTAASVLASGEGSGANLVQATYYPKRRFFDKSADWVGGLQNLWYYLDPQFSNSTIRVDDGDKILHLQTDGAHQDYLVTMFYDESVKKAQANLFSDSDGDAAPDGQIGTFDVDELPSLWEAGILLWNRDPATRTIYTALTSTQPLTASANMFSASAPNNIAALRPFLLTDDATATGAENDQLAANVINYVRGVEVGNYVYSAGTKTEVYRPRALKIDLNKNDNVTDPNVFVHGVMMDETVAKVWKLGDIINSTPKIASWVFLNDYHKRYSDSTYTAYISSASYTNRGMVYVGANDGMLHAFNLGHMEQNWAVQNKMEKARLTGTDLGKEMWAFIPKNVLPYLQYLKESDYCHISSVDLTPFLFDASINKPAGCTGDYWNCTKTEKSWRTILIGGMRLGGACRDTASTCTDCVKTPVSGKGYSSYFALDVTDEANPVFLWEFSDPELGFTTPGPAVVKISARVAGAGNSTADRSKNGRFFVVLATGPTGPIDATSQKFLGRSDQELKVFVLDLLTGIPATVSPISTGITNAFAGSMLDATLDVDGDYQDDVLYIPYVKRTGSNPNYTWTDGGVLRLLTDEDKTGSNVSAGGDTALNPANWRISTLIDNIGPVSASVAHLYDIEADKVWSLFGSGRYFFKSINGTDDADGLRHLYSMTDPCWVDVSTGWSSACLDADPANDLTRTKTQLFEINLASTAGTSNEEGWYIDLEPSGTYTYDENGNGTTADDVPRKYFAERVITDPLVTQQGLVFFTTLKPYDEACSIGGKSFIWSAYYSSGAAGGNLLEGTALIQVSTGSIEQMELKDVFTNMGGRRTGAIEGVPPIGQGLSIVSQPSPVSRLLFMREH